MAENYEAVIGLEIHVQLSTRTKMFCGCELSFGEPPNTRTCPVCLALPGALPVVNAEAIHYGLMIGMALDCDIAPRSIFHRKNYFYPDSPKAYQISQYDIPLARSGQLGDVRIHRVHLEEDAAKLVHAGTSGRIHGSEASLVDFNRAGTPLVEIVSEPDLRSAADAAEWGRLLRATLKRLGVSDVNMDEGSLRVDANVSIRPAGEATYGTKTELKNMNSFRFLERGIEAELRRQEEILRGGGEVEQETLHFELGDYFEEALAADSADPRTLANWVRNELVKRIGETDPSESKVTPAALAQLVGMVEGKSVSQSAAKTVLDALVEGGGDPQRIVEQQGLAAMDDSGELDSIVQQAIDADPAAVEQIKSGNNKAIGALMGAVMRETKGRADGQVVQRLIREKIGA